MKEPTMTSLANDIYKCLLRKLRANTVSLTYRELADALGKKHGAHPRSPRLHAALGEVSQACRHSDLPCLPAIVWRVSPRRPGDGYYAVAHPRAHTEEAKIAAWEREHARVIAEAPRFPASL
jgi:hypothetical protein